MMTFEGEIRDLSQGGMGVVNGPDGCVYFVDGTWPGDHGTFEITSKKKRYGFAKLIKLLKSSEHRLSESPCKYHGTEDGTCGGCPWILFEYDDQINRKNHLIKYALDRAKILTQNTILHPTLKSPTSLGYRNRAQLKTDGTKLGFVSHQKKTLVDVESCVVLNQECSKRLSDLRNLLPNPLWSPSKNYLWNFIEINDMSEWNPKSVALNQRLPFLQGNHAQNEAMKSWLATTISSLKGSHDALELFCGEGNFTEILSKSNNLNSIVASEISESAIEILNNKKLSKVSTLAWNLYKPSSWSRLKALIKHPSLLFLDPPREGFEPIANFMERFESLQHVIYISCSLNTFARDAAQLTRLGFEALEIQPVDMFPNTPHIEICSLFSRP